MRSLAAAQEWTLVAQASSPEELQGVTPAVTELSAGQRVRAEIHLSLPVAQAADLPGFDWLAKSAWQAALSGADVRVDRVFASGSRIIIMEGTVTGTPVLLILAAIAVVLFAVSFLAISIRFLVTGESPSFLPNIGVLLLGAGALVLFSGRSRGRT
ncbi:MAG: hypothetical protein WD533_06470 [Dehalococcoidia bacterium]